MEKKKRANTTASLKHERDYQRHGCNYIFGIDEAGRGPWAGHVAAGVVCLPLDRKDLQTALKGVRDSKLMTPNQRESMVDTIKEVALAWGVGDATAEEIDQLGIIPATKLAMERALTMAMENSDIEPDCLFMDYMLWPERKETPQVSIVSGDKYSLSIACASVLAKVWRDEYMVDIAEEFPQYGFDAHKGYGTESHRNAIKTYGPTPLHRKTFKPIREVMEQD